MKKVVVGIIALIAIGCQETDVMSDFTGNESVYALEAGAVYPISGTATFKEKKDGSTVVVIELTGTEGSLQHPVHLHLGDISSPGAAVAALLTPVLGNTGKSETTLTQLADETVLNYEQLIELNACIKIHLGESGPDRDIILAGGNIGNAANARMGGNAAFGICKSE